jgi:hypothetical protein
MADGNFLSPDVFMKRLFYILLAGVVGFSAAAVAFVFAAKL